MMRTLVLSACLIVALVGCQPSPAPSPAPEPDEEVVIQTTAQTLLDMHNEQRKLHGKPPLRMDGGLLKYAQNHANWMATNGQLKHSDISTLVRQYGAVGENIAWGQTTEQQVMNSWMKSPGHRANILNGNYTKAGFGMASKKGGRPYWCAVFGQK